jgi:hypothetical protein
MGFRPEGRERDTQPVRRMALSFAYLYDPITVARQANLPNPKSQTAKMTLTFPDVPSKFPLPLVLARAGRRVSGSKPTGPGRVPLISLRRARVIGS